MILRAPRSSGRRASTCRLWICKPRSASSSRNRRSSSVAKEFAERLARFRSEKEVTKARYRAAEAMVKIGEATTGLGEDMASAGRALERANEKTQALEARAAALDELIATGGLDDISGETQLDRELRQLSTTTQVDAELARMKAELAPAKEPPAIEA